MLNSARLQVLLEISRHGTVAAAAAELRLTASAVSHALAKLEREVGVSLVERSARSVQLTPAGSRLAEHAQRITDLMAAAEEELAAHGGAKAGLLRVGFFASAGVRLLPRALSRFAARRPDADLELILGQPHELLPTLEGGQLDAVVVFEHPLDPWVRPANVTVQHLLDDPQMLVMPADHPYVDRDDARLHDFADDAWIATFGTGSGTSVVERACSHAGFAPRVRCRSDHYEVTVGLVQAGLGIALVPMLGLRVSGGVRIRRLRERGLYRDIGVAVRASNPNPLVPLLVQELREAASEAQRGMEGSVDPVDSTR